jgi:hypothetical protein
MMDILNVNCYSLLEHIMERGVEHESESVVS